MSSNFGAILRTRNRDDAHTTHMHNRDTHSSHACARTCTYAHARTQEHARHLSAQARTLVTRTVPSWQYFTKQLQRHMCKSRGHLATPPQTQVCLGACTQLELHQPRLGRRCTRQTQRTQGMSAAWERPYRYAPPSKRIARMRRARSALSSTEKRRRSPTHPHCWPYCWPGICNCCTPVCMHAALMLSVHIV